MQEHWLSYSHFHFQTLFLFLPHLSLFESVLNSFSFLLLNSTLQTYSLIDSLKHLMLIRIFPLQLPLILIEHLHHSVLSAASLIHLSSLWSHPSPLLSLPVTHECFKFLLMYLIFTVLTYPFLIPVLSFSSHNSNCYLQFLSFQHFLKSINFPISIFNYAGSSGAPPLSLSWSLWGYHEAPSIFYSFQFLLRFSIHTTSSAPCWMPL